jgi:D-aminoacyl-tRNA deacylase
VDDACVIVISAQDPVATAVADRWGDLPSIGRHVDGTALRRLSSSSLLLRRPGRHIHDEHIDRLLPRELQERVPTLVFPSVHRSDREVECLTVHPLGNPGPTADLGGRPRTLVPTDPKRMAATLRRLHESSAAIGWRSTFEATHHGPELGVPAFFVEIGHGRTSTPTPETVRIVAEAIQEMDPDPRDRVALGIGGGHYVPHLTDLALRRRWSFGHLLSKHALATLDAPTAREAWTKTPGAEGVVYSRAEDAQGPLLSGLGPRLRDQDAPSLEEGARPSGASRSASGT